jgi:hypothetical protein
MLIGVVIFWLGYGVYYPTMYRDTTWRTFQYAIFGEALILSSGVWFLMGLPKASQRLQKIVVRGLTISFYAGLVFLSVYIAFQRLSNEVHIAKVNDYVTASIIEQAPHVQPNTVIVLLAPPNSIIDIPGGGAGGGVGLDLRLRYTYQNYGVQTIACWTDAISSDQPVDSCKFGSENLTFRPAGSSTDISYPYDSLLVFDNHECDVRLLDNLDEYSKGTVSYHPDQLIINREVPPRVYTLYPSWPMDSSKISHDYLCH